MANCDFRVQCLRKSFMTLIFLFRENLKRRSNCGAKIYFFLFDSFPSVASRKNVSTPKKKKKRIKKNVSESKINSFLLRFVIRIDIFLDIDDDFSGLVIQNPLLLLAWRLKKKSNNQ